MERMLSELRNLGWRVAVHNDYQLNGEFYTFWLFTHSNGRWVKGEGRSDGEALEIAAALAAAEHLDNIGNSNARA